MAKTKKITIAAFEKAMKDTYVPTETFQWNGIEVCVKKNLTLKEVMEFVNNVTSGCFAGQTNTYISEVKDFIIKANVLERYSNLTLPKDIERQYELIYSTDIFNHILNHINTTQINEIISAINEKINYKVQEHIEATNMKINELCASLDNIHTQFESIFGGFNTDDMLNLFKTLSSSNLNEKELIKAYIEVKDDNNGCN